MLVVTMASTSVSKGLALLSERGVDAVLIRGASSLVGQTEIVLERAHFSGTERVSRLGPLGRESFS